MTRPRIALLNAAVEPAATRRNFRREVDADLVELHCPGGDRPATYGVDGAIVTGSRRSVYDDEPWIADLGEWIEGAIERDLPVLGVCFGHQLLADVLGGTVESMGEYEIGYRTVERDGPSDLLVGIDEEFTVFTTHADRVVELPPDAERIASNDYGVQGFRLGDVRAVQFHPEYDRETAASVARGKDLADGKLERVLAGITDENYAAACEVKRLFDNFLDVVAKRRADGATVGGRSGE